MINPDILKLASEGRKTNSHFAEYKIKQERFGQIAVEIIELLKTKEVTVFDAEDILDIARKLLKETIVK